MKKNTTYNKKKTSKFTWNVLTWDFNHDELEIYDVVPILMSEYKRIKKNDKPKTKNAFNEFLKNEAQYHFWSKCEYEVVVHDWPAGKNETKIDVYDQLLLNWDAFVDAFWNSLNKTTNADHRKQRGRTAPNRALKDK